MSGPTPSSSSSSSSAAGRSGALVAPGRAMPSDVVSALKGSSTVSLGGFAQHQRGPSFLRPGVLFVSPSISTEELRSVLMVRSVRMKALMWATIICSHLAVAFGVTLLYRQQGQAQPPSPASWAVVSVQPRDVLVRIGQAEQASTFAVPVGGRLPNGDVLTMVDAERQMFATRATRVFLNDGGRR